MTRWPRTWALLTGEPILTDAQRRAQDAKQRADAAYARGDDRALGRARMELAEAQNERLRRGE